jgi:hypothetical protein
VTQHNADAYPIEIVIDEDIASLAIEIWLAREGSG